MTATMTREATGTISITDLDAHRDRELHWFAAQSLFVDHDYQRPLNEGRVKRIAADWNDLAVGALIVSIRADGTRALMDGYHRNEAAKVARGPETPMPCIGYRGLTPVQEAALFAAYNGDKRSNPTKIQLFKSRLAGHEPKAEAIYETILACGLDVAWSANGPANAHGINGIASIEDVYNQGGAPFLSIVLGLLKDTWHGRDGCYSGVIIYGMAMFVGRHYGEYDRANLIEKLTGYLPADIVRRSKTLRDFDPSSNVATAIALVMRNIYNQGKRKHTLPEFVGKVSAKQLAARLEATDATT